MPYNISYLDFNIKCQVGILWHFVEVKPGDVIVADGNGVVLVPQDLAEEIARRAKLIQDKDRPGRSTGYEKLGLPLDEIVM
jgi:regulator of RNase E activity RraA